jgi:hypothetical protein
MAQHNIFDPVNSTNSSQRWSQQTLASTPVSYTHTTSYSHPRLSWPNDYNNDWALSRDIRVSHIPDNIISFTSRLFSPLPHFPFPQRNEDSPAVKTFVNLTSDYEGEKERIGSM